MKDNATSVTGLRVGILGGSFNPAHDGHLEITDAARRTLGLHRVWWLVSPQNPLKAAKDYLPLAERLDRAKTLTQGRAWLRISDLETELNSTFTADTLQTITSRYPSTQFVWIMGADNLASFHKWRAWRKIAQTVPIAVISRPGYDLKALRSPMAQILAQYRYRPANAEAILKTKPPAWVFLPTVHNSLSATALRQL